MKTFGVLGPALCLNFDKMLQKPYINRRLRLTMKTAQKKRTADTGCPHESANAYFLFLLPVAANTQNTAKMAALMA